jgi:macrolide-specific efflux system membrane fusion protein
MESISGLAQEATTGPVAFRLRTEDAVGSLSSTGEASPLAPAPPDSAPEAPALPPEPAPADPHPVFEQRPRSGARRGIATAVLAVACIAAAALTLHLLLASQDDFPAVIQPGQLISLNFPRAGSLTALAVNPGDHVTAGQVLARLNASSDAAAVSSAQAAVGTDKQELAAARAQAAAAAARAKAGGQPGSAPVDVGLASARLTQDNALLAQAQLALGQDTIRSPIAGIVVSVGGAVGDLVGPDGVQSSGGAAPITTQSSHFSLFPQSPSSPTGVRPTTNALVEVAGGPVQAEAQIPESAIAGLRPGRRAIVSVPALGTRYGAQLLRVVPNPVQVDSTVSYEALFALSGATSSLLPGMSADLALRPVPKTPPPASGHPRAGASHSAR